MLFKGPLLHDRDKWADEFKRDPTSYVLDEHSEKPKIATTIYNIKNLHQMVLHDPRIKDSRSYGLTTKPGLFSLDPINIPKVLLEIRSQLDS